MFPQVKTPDFIFTRPFTNESITALRVKDVETGSTINVDFSSQYNDVYGTDQVVTAFMGDDTINLPCGYYYYEIECGPDMFYSEVWGIDLDVQSEDTIPDDWIKLEVKGTCNINGIPFDTFTDYKMQTFLKTEAQNPNYEENIEQEEDEKGITTIVSRTQYKDYLYTIERAYQPLVDHLRQLRSYLVDQGSVTLTLPNGVTLEVLDIDVDDPDYFNDCQPLIRMRIRTEDNTVACCDATPDRCNFKAPSPILSNVGLDVTVTAGLDDATFAEIRYGIGGLNTQGGTYTNEELQNGVVITVPSNGTYEFGLYVETWNCAVKISPSTTITV